MIEMNAVEVNKQSFITDFTLPTGETIYKDMNEPDRVGFSRLIGFEGHRLTLKFSDGEERYGVLIAAAEDYINVKFDDEQEE